MPGRADYEERRQDRIDRLNGAAYAASKEAEAQYKHSHDLVKNIPLGQPNIVGRSALPRLREKSRNALEKSVALDDKAAYYAGCAESAENNHAISSDDPEAINKLYEKIAALETKKEKIKEFNKAAKKNGTEPAPWYELPYANKEIKRLKDRIAKLESIDQMPAELIEFDGGEIESDPITNRVIIRYDQRQDDSTTDRLKSNGFHWSPTEKVWMRLRNPGALRVAEIICGVNPKEAE